MVTDCPQLSPACVHWAFLARMRCSPAHALSYRADRTFTPWEGVFRPWAWAVHVLTL